MKKRDHVDGSGKGVVSRRETPEVVLETPLPKASEISAGNLLGLSNCVEVQPGIQAGTTLSITIVGIFQSCRYISGIVVETIMRFVIM